MNKKGGVFSVLVILLLIAALLYVGYAYWKCAQKNLTLTLNPAGDLIINTDILNPYSLNLTHKPVIVQERIKS